MPSSRKQSRSAPVAAEPATPARGVSSKKQQSSKKQPQPQSQPQAAAEMPATPAGSSGRKRKAPESSTKGKPEEQPKQAGAGGRKSESKKPQSQSQQKQQQQSKGSKKGADKQEKPRDKSQKKQTAKAKKTQKQAKKGKNPRKPSVAAAQLSQVHRCRFVEWNPAAVLCAEFCPAGERLAVARGNGDIEVWRVLSPKRAFCQLRIPGSSQFVFTCLVWLPPLRAGGEPRLLSGGLSGRLIEWDLVTLTPRASVQSFGGAIHCATAALAGAQAQPQRQVLGDSGSGDGEVVTAYARRIAASRQVALGCADGTVRIFDTEGDSENLATTIAGALGAAGPAGEGASSGGLVYRRGLSGHQAPVLSLDWVGERLVSGGADGTVRLWVSEAGGRLWNQTRVIEFEGAHVDRPGASGKSRARQKRKLLESGARTQVYAVKLLREGRELVTGDSLGHVQFWETKFGTLRHSFQKHEAEVKALAVAHDESAVYAAGVDNTVAEFRCVASTAPNGRTVSAWVPTVFQRPHTHTVNALAVSPKRAWSLDSAAPAAGGSAQHQHPGQGQHHQQQSAQAQSQLLQAPQHKRPRLPASASSTHTGALVGSAAGLAAAGGAPEQPLEAILVSAGVDTQLVLYQVECFGMRPVKILPLPVGNGGNACVSLAARPVVEWLAAGAGASDADSEDEGAGAKLGSEDEDDDAMSDDEDDDEGDLVDEGDDEEVDSDVEAGDSEAEAGDHDDDDGAEVAAAGRPAKRVRRSEAAGTLASAARSGTGAAAAPRPWLLVRQDRSLQLYQLGEQADLSAASAGGSSDTEADDEEAAEAESGSGSAKPVKRRQINLGNLPLREPSNLLLQMLVDGSPGSPIPALNLLCAQISPNGEWIVCSDALSLKVFRVDTSMPGATPGHAWTPVVEPIYAVDRTAEQHLGRLLPSNAALFSDDSSLLILGTLAGRVQVFDLEHQRMLAEFADHAGPSRLLPKYLRPAAEQSDSEDEDEGDEAAADGSNEDNEDDDDDEEDEDDGKAKDAKQQKPSKKTAAAQDSDSSDSDSDSSDDDDGDGGAGLDGSGEDAALAQLLGQASAKQAGVILSLALSSDGRWLASVDHRNRVCLYDLQSLASLQKREGAGALLPTFRYPVTAIAFVPGSAELLVACASNELFLLSADASVSSAAAMDLSDAAEEGDAGLLETGGVSSRVRKVAVPRALQANKDPVSQIAFDPARPGVAFLQAHSFIQRLPLPGTAAGQEGEPVPPPQFISRFGPNLYFGFAGPRTAVVVERPWLKVLQQLPEPEHERLRYGAN